MVSVLHVAQPTITGVARVVSVLVEDQVRRGWDVTVACPVEGELAAASTSAGARHVSWQARRSPGPWTVAEATALSRLIARQNPDLVHLHSMKAGLVGRLVLRGTRPTLYQPHAWPFSAAGVLLRPLSLIGERSLARWVDSIVCVSAHERREGEEARIRADLQVISNGVNLAQYPAADAPMRRAARHALGLGNDPLVVCVGRLSRQKGQDVLLAAWPEIHIAHPSAHLIFVGEGPSRESLEATRPARVTFAGSCSDTAVFYQAADVVAAPSRWEGMALTLLEALSSARSVVASDVAGMREVLTQEGSPAAGAIVAPDDPGALAAAISKRLSDPALAAAEGRQGRVTVERHYSVRSQTEQVARLVTDTLGSS